MTLGYQGPRDVLVTHGLEVGEKVVSENLLLLMRQYRISQDTSRPAAEPASGGASNAVPGVRPAASAAR